MRFSCTQENLKRGLQATGYVAGKNLNLPILNNVHIRIEGSNIELTSTNLEIAVRCLIRGKVDEGGEITIPSKLFLEYVNLLPEDRVDMELSDTTLKVACRKHATRIKGLPAAEFPLIPTVEGQKTFTIDGRDMKEALGQVSFAVSSNESRPELTGALFAFNQPHAPGKLLLAATDSYRLSERTMPFSKGTSSSAVATIIVPGKTLNELSRILSIQKDSELEEAKIVISIGEGQISFKIGDIELISRVIEGKYPDYRPIIPERFSSEAVFKKSEVAQAVKGASLFSRAGLQDVHFRVDPKEGLVISSSEGQMGKNESAVEAKIEGPMNSITLNYRYFLEGLGAIQGDKARLRVIDAMNPCVLLPEQDDADGKLLYIVMPIKQ